MSEERKRKSKSKSKSKKDDKKKDDKKKDDDKKKKSKKDKPNLGVLPARKVGSSQNTNVIVNIKNESRKRDKEPKEGGTKIGAGSSAGLSAASKARGPAGNFGGYVSTPTPAVAPTPAPAVKKEPGFFKDPNFDNNGVPYALHYLQGLKHGLQSNQQKATPMDKALTGPIITEVEEEEQPSQKSYTHFESKPSIQYEMEGIEEDDDGPLITDNPNYVSEPTPIFSHGLVPVDPTPTPLGAVSMSNEKAILYEEEDEEDTAPSHNLVSNDPEPTPLDPPVKQLKIAKKPSPLTVPEVKPPESFIVETVEDDEEAIPIPAPVKNKKTKPKKIEVEEAEVDEAEVGEYDEFAGEDRYIDVGLPQGLYDVATVIESSSLKSIKGQIPYEDILKTFNELYPNEQATISQGSVKRTFKDNISGKSVKINDIITKIQSFNPDLYIPKKSKSKSKSK